MRRTVVGAVAVMTASSVFTLTGVGLAGAARMVPATPPGVTAATAPSTEVTTLRTLHDTLDSQWQVRDTTGMRTTQAGLATELARLPTSQGYRAMAPDAVTEIGKAQQQNATLGDQLAVPSGESAAAAPPDLGGLEALIQSLLQSILSLVASLTGVSLPVPTPTG
jgi:hypothetical protein